MLGQSARRYALVVVVLSFAATARAESKTLGRCGQGWLEEVDGYRVLHIKGTPYEMGFQQGRLLKDDIRELVRFLFDVKAKEFSKELKFTLGGVQVKPDAKAIIATIAESQKRFVPAKYFEEMRGIADGAEMDVQEIIVANFIPEMFHCSGFALSG